MSLFAIVLPSNMVDAEDGFFVQSPEEVCLFEVPQSGIRSWVDLMDVVDPLSMTDLPSFRRCAFDHVPTSGSRPYMDVAPFVLEPVL